jgi:hypothetical protein
VLRQALRHDLGYDLALPPSLSRQISGDNAATSLLLATARAKTPIARIGGIRQAETHPRFPRAPKGAARGARGMKRQFRQAYVEPTSEQDELLRWKRAHREEAQIQSRMGKRGPPPSKRPACGCVNPNDVEKRVSSGKRRESHPWLVGHAILNGIRGWLRSGSVWKRSGQICAN